MEVRKQQNVARWRIPEHADEIELSRALLEEVLTAAKEGFNRFPRGGLEVGGVLFGARDEGRVRVLAARPIDCKHTLGPSFTLTPEEHDELAGFVARCKQDTELAELVPVGWYHSHTRSGLLLSDADCHLHNRHFPHVWQIALLVRPEASQPAELGIFVRGKDGELPARPALVLSEEALGPAGDASEAGQAVVSEDEEATRQERRAAGPLRWRAVWWAAAALGLVAALLVADEFQAQIRPYGQALAAHWERARNYWVKPTPTFAGRPFELSLSSAGTQLLVRWNSASDRFGQSDQARLVFWDGEDRQEIALDRESLARGGMTLERHSENVTVTLVSLRNGDQPVRETARLVGTVPAQSPGKEPRSMLPALRVEKEQLEIALRLQKTESDTLAERLNSLQGVLKTRSAPPPPALAPSPAPPPVLAQKAPEPAPVEVVLEQRPEASPAGVTTPGSAPPAAPEAVPTSGRIIWTGALEPGRVLAIQGRQASHGSFSGQLPGFPVRVVAYPAELSGVGLTVYTTNPKHRGAGATEAPGPGNAWTRTVYRYAPDRAGTVQVIQAPGEQNGWRAISVRSSGNLAAVVIEWETIR